MPLLAILRLTKHGGYGIIGSITAQYKGQIKPLVCQNWIRCKCRL